MSKELVKKTFTALYKEDAVLQLANLDEFNTLLNQNPPAKWVKQNPFANNSKYLPIDKVEYMLRKIYKEVEIEILREGVMFNSVYCVVRIHYTNPVTGEKKFQDGTGAKQIQTKKGASPADFANINNNAVEMALPIAKTNATKDACHNLGRIFGSDLNRKEVLEHAPDEVLQDKKFEIEKKRVEELIANGQEVSQEIREKYGIQN